MYQFDSGNDLDLEMVRQSLNDGPGGDEAHERGFALAANAWEWRHEADERVAALTPDWPTYRQPVVDRNLLRLAYFEMSRGDTPAKVAINEAVELAKEFGSEKSPMFINGVLDKIYRSIRDAGTAPVDADSTTEPAQNSSSINGETFGE